MMGDGIFNVDGEKWVRQRKVAVLEFSSSKLRDHSTKAFRLKALKLLDVLRHLSQLKQPVDMQDLFMRLTLDSICEVGFGVDPETLSNDLPAVPFANAFDEANRLIIRRYVDILWKVKRALNLGSEARLRRCVQVVNEFIYGVIVERRAEFKETKFHHTERADLLSRFMSVPNQDGQPYSNRDLRDVIINFIIAGRDTTALTLTWLFSMLCKHPMVVKNILKEVSSVLGEQTVKPAQNCAEVDGPLQTSRIESIDNCDETEFANLLTYQALNRMSYLHACITEALRLYPAVPLETKIAVSDDIFPDGTKIKAGNFVSYVPYSMGRLEYIWGPDAMEFKPERWLKDGHFQPQSPFKLTAFQAGPRMCLGKDSAYLQMKITTLLLLKFFSFKLADDCPSKYSMMVVLYMAGGLKTLVTPL
ncbi:hypothetical protein KP509_16G033600 [Ceratopteris richardii]|nr:hypothetical protein KP509_16G033600 [Ceratopteris richardii]